jgi:hypothetical protein
MGGRPKFVSTQVNRFSSLACILFKPCRQEGSLGAAPSVAKALPIAVKAVSFRQIKRSASEQ